MIAVYEEGEEYFERIPANCPEFYIVSKENEDTFELKNILYRNTLVDTEMTLVSSEEVSEKELKNWIEEKDYVGVEKGHLMGHYQGMSREYGVDEDWSEEY